MLKTRCCFVGDGLSAAEQAEEDAADRLARESRMAVEPAAEAVDAPVPIDDEAEDEELLLRMERCWSKRATATTISLKVPGGSSAPASGVGKGWIQVPGWVRERAAEVLFEETDRDEASLQASILECLSKLPIDLRRPLASSILLTGGTPMMPGFFPRLRHELLATLALSHPPSPPPSPPASEDSPRAALVHAALRSRLHTLRHTPHFHSLASLSSSIILVNDPSHSGSAKTGKATAFAPSLLGWVGGSLVGALKTGGEEVTRERWEEARAARDLLEEEEMEEEVERGAVMGLPDWTELRNRGCVG